MLPVPGASEFSGPNPEYGALITYYLRGDPPKRATPPTAAGPDAGRAGVAPGADGGPARSDQAGTKAGAGPAKADTVRIVVLAPDGSVVRELEGPDRKGINRVSWDLRYPLTFKPAESDEGWFGPPRGTFVLPGEYTIKLSARGRDLTQRVQVVIDPRARTTPQALQARFEASQSVAELQRAFVESADVVQAVAKELEAVNAAIEDRERVAGDVTAAVKEFTATFDEVKKRFRSEWSGPRFRIFDLAGQLQASTSAPTDAQLRSLDQLKAQLTADIAELNGFTSRTFPAFQERMRAAGLIGTAVKPVAPPKK
jgi:hypothetical protein